MPRKLEVDGEEAHRAHIVIYRSDHDYVMSRFGGSTGYSRFIRSVLHTVIKRLRSAEEHGAQAAPDVVLEEIKNG